MRLVIPMAIIMIPTDREVGAGLEDICVDPCCKPDEVMVDTGLTVTKGFAEMVSRSISVAAPVSSNIMKVLLYDPVAITLPSPDMDRLTGKSSSWCCHERVSFPSR